MVLLQKVWKALDLLLPLARIAFQNDISNALWPRAVEHACALSVWAKRACVQSTNLIVFQRQSDCAVIVSIDHAGRSVSFQKPNAGVFARFTVGVLPKIRRAWNKALVITGIVLFASMRRSACT